MSVTQAITLTIDDHHIAWLAIDVTSAKMNILQRCVIDEMAAILAQLDQQQDDIRALIIHSLKSDHFVVGADIHMIDACHDEDGAQALSRLGQSLFSQLEALSFPTIAAVHGACLGGGLELILACDYRLCSDDPQTHFAFPEIQLGFIPGAGGTQRLPRIMATGKALEMMLTGKSVYSKKALVAGLVDAVVQTDGVLDACRQVALGTVNLERRINVISRSLASMRRVLWIDQLICEWARRQAQKKAHHHYPAIDALINAVKAGFADGLDAGYELEARLFGQLVMTAQSKALRGLFFATTELKNTWKQHADKLTEVRQLAVLGGGLMGAGISYVSIERANLPVILKDIEHTGVVNTLDYCYRRLKNKAARQGLSRLQLTKKMALLTGGLDFRGFEQADVVIEAVFEDLALKQHMVDEVEIHCSPQTIFATNTSSLPIQRIAQAARRPELVVGLHYFSPVEKMPLVEIIPHAQTAPEVVAKIALLAYQQGKIPITVRDGAGFYVNRILVPYIQGAVACLLAGEPIENIDRALVRFGFPVGPFTLLDEVGIGLAAKIPDILRSQFGERYDKPDVLNKLVNAGRLGKKSGHGFYRYQKGKKVDAQIYSLLNITLYPHLDAEDIAMRCVIPLLNEAARCFHESVIGSAQEGDIGAVYGMGFPPFLGGPFRYMHCYGLLNLCDVMEQYANHFGERYQPCEALMHMATEQQSFYE